MIFEKSVLVGKDIFKNNEEKIIIEGDEYVCDYLIIFKHDNKYYKVKCWQDKTTGRDSFLDEGEKIKCTEVELKVEMVKRWREVNH